MSLKRNIIANYLGQGWIALMNLAFIPLYITYLGMESYGLIGIFVVLQNVLTLLDMGMSPVLNREMARFTAGSHTAQSIRELLHSIELVCFGLSVVIIISAIESATWIAQHWLHIEELSLNTVSNAIAIMGVVAALRFVESIYRSSIMGLQTQVWLNGVMAVFATLRGFGAVGIIIWVSPTIEAFFIWQGCISLISVIVLALRLHHILPVAMQPVRFSKLALSEVWNFARGMIATTFLSLLLTHVDKILLSRLLSLETFGIYTLAATVANALMLLVAPIAQSYYPRFTELVTQHDEPNLITAYHQSSQLMNIMLVPVALMLIFYGETVLYLWTGDSALAHKSAPLVALLTLGTAFLGLMNIPYMLQLAYGWSAFAAKVNAAIVVVQIPTLFWTTSHYGAIGAAWVWVAITSSYIFVVIPIMHLHLLPKEKWIWYLQDNALPSLTVSCIILTSIWVYPEFSSKLGQFIWLISISFFSFISSMLSTPMFRKKLLCAIKRRS